MSSAYRSTRYLNWARQHYGKVPCDLATSGTPPASVSDFAPLGASTDDLGTYQRLRESIARYNDVPEAEAIAALGTSHAIWLAYAALLSPGDHVLVETPHYEPLVRAAESVGATVTFFDRGPDRAYRVDPSVVARAFTDRTRLVAISNLHNPSGVRASDEEIVELAKLTAARGAHLLVDEVYAPFDGLCDSSGVFGRSARRLHPNIVAVASLTKCFGVGVDRVGWLLGPRQLIDSVEDVLTITVGVMPLSQAHVAVQAFTHLPVLAKRSTALLGNKREQVTAWAKSHPSIRWSEPKAGLFGLAVMQGKGDLTETIERGADEHGVLVAAGSFFGIPNAFRLGWSVAPDVVDSGLERLLRVFAFG